MSKIPVNDLIALFRRMYDERWKYTLGHAVEGDVDCSGAFVNAYKQFGRSIAHGSNAIARSYVEGLLPIREAVPGMAAFKFYPPGHPKWNLPTKYREGGAAYNGDLNDYYHIGTVDETGKFVLNAQGTKAGFTRTKLSLWGCVGYLKAVDYGDEEGSPMQEMRVIADSGMTVKMRSRPDKQSVVLANVLVGTVLSAGESDGEWTPVTFEGRKGWMMSKFLAPASEGAENPSAPAGTSPLSGETGFVRTLSTEEYNRLCEVREHLSKDLEFIKIIVGVG